MVRRSFSNANPTGVRYPRVPAEAGNSTIANPRVPAHVGFAPAVVDPSSHNTNPPGVFGGPSLEWLTEDAARNAEALDAVIRFIEQHGQLPTQDSWTAAGMSPCERTVRTRFGSFCVAAEAAGLTVRP